MHNLLFVRAFIIVVVILGATSCGKGGPGAAGGLGGLAGGGGLLGDVGKLVNAQARNSQAMMDLRRDVTVLQSKLNMLAGKRVFDYAARGASGGEQELRRQDEWINRILSSVLRVSFKSSNQMENDFRQDMSGFKRLRDFLAYLRNTGFIRTMPGQEYDLFYSKCLKGCILVEVLNVRAQATAAMLSALSHTIESFSVDMKRIEDLRRKVAEVINSAPI
ncbi:MAG: hypothetical protein OXC30_03865 [Alphaproteobacteria bacterium]|nr:hypothetical protein [Alphaproteobacteria bacterium]